MGLGSGPDGGWGGGGGGGVGMGAAYGNTVLIPLWAPAQGHSRLGLSRLGHLPWLTLVALQPLPPTGLQTPPQMQQSPVRQGHLGRMV